MFRISALRVDDFRRKGKKERPEEGEGEEMMERLKDGSQEKGYKRGRRRGKDVGSEGAEEVYLERDRLCSCV